jgi:ethanolamine utilization protein EutA
MGLMAFSNHVLPGNRPLIVIIERDYAQAVGQTFRAMAPSRPLLVNDRFGMEGGDYVDIGTPAMDGHVEPVNVKRLIFYY